MIEKKNAPPPMFSTDKVSALEAISKAQFIAFAPYVFQASVLLRDKNILQHLADSRTEGQTFEQLKSKTDISKYALRVLLEAGLGIGLLYKKEEVYHLSKTGHFFNSDAMSRVNTDFMRDICYDGAQNLEASFESGQPKGLKHLGPWETIYQGLSILNEPGKTSWFNFDHFYSDNAFPEALPLVFDKPVNALLDIGGNTGKWSLACLNYNEQVRIGIVDLPIQIDVASKNIEAAGFSDRASYHPMDVLLESTQLPTGYDAIWMSQFLDCFSDQQIVFILKKCYEALAPDGRLFINETFWDHQRFEASAFSLQMTSLYFTTMANGNSQMYESTVFYEFIKEAGFQITQEHRNLGLGHTLLILQKIN